MEMVLIRNLKNSTTTIGSLYINDSWECYTLEDAVRQVYGQPVEAWKIKEHTAIPTGRYRVIINYSNRFKVDMPLLLDVPGFSGIRIHPGNTHANTEGCILVGRTILNDNFIGESRVAYDSLYAKIQAAYSSDRGVYITIA